MKTLIIIGIFVLFLAGSAIYFHYRMKKIARERGKPDICAYAKSFDYRNVDTAIMREVYNQVQEWAGRYEGVPFPVKAEDSFNDLYQIDEGDLEDIVVDIAEKLSISLDNFEKNPYWSQMTTVKGLVLFLHHQPRINNN